MEEDFISLDNNYVQNPQGETIDLGVGVSTPLISESAATVRAEKYNYALGEKSPGASQIYQQIISGMEGDLRDNTSVQNALELDKFKLDYAAKIIKDKNGAPLDQGEWDAIQGMSQTSARDPNTVMEKMYAERVMSDAFYTADKGPVADARAAAPDDTNRILDTAEVVIQNTEFVKKIVEDQDIKWKDTSMPAKAWDYIEGFIPFKSWSNTQNAVAELEGSSFLQGNNMRDQITYLWTLPPSQFAQSFKTAFDDIASRNQNDAYMFATAVLSYGNTDLAWNNLQSLSDIADLTSAGGAVIKGASALAKGVRAADAVAGEIGQAVASREGRISASTPGTATINDPNGGVGINIREGGPTSPITGSPAANTQQINDLNGGMGVNIQRQGPTSPMPGSNVRINNPDGGFGVNIPVVGATQNIADARAAVQRTVHSLASRSDVDIPEVLSAAGSPNAAPTGAFKSIRTQAMANVPDPTGSGQKAMMQDLLKHMPTYMDPTAIAKGSYRFTREEADRIIQRVNESVGISKRSIDEANGLERLSDAALWEAVTVAREQVKREFPHINNAITDISVNDAAENVANVYSVNFDLKQTSGELFKTKAQAEFYAKNMYKLNDFSIEPQGNGYFVRVSRNIDETHPDVRDALIDTNNTTPQSFANRFLGAMQGATEKLSKTQTEARVKSVHGTQRDLAQWSEILKPVVELQSGISKASKERFLRFVTADNSRLRTDPVTGKPVKGDFYRSLGEFENAWYKSFNRWPEEKEAKAYFTYLAAYDHDYIRRNLDIYRFKARQGVSNFKLNASVNNEKAPSFEGKFVTDTFDRHNLTSDATIAIWDKKSSSATILRREDFQNRGVAERFDNMLNGGYQVVQIFDPLSRPLQSIDVGSVVNFVVTREFENAKLGFEQIPYKPGGHVAYDFREGIKQPKIQQIGNQRIYFGDTAVRMTNTPAEAQALVKNYEQARVLLKDNKLSEFKSFVSKNLPDDPDDLIAQFKAGTLDIDAPFVHTSDGMRSIDDMGFASRLGQFKDPQKDPYNLAKGMSTEFSGERSLGETPSVKNVGTEQNPVFGFQPTKYMDALDTINRAGAQLARSKWLDDYRTLSAESFVQEFSDVLNVSPELARSNPIAVLMNKDIFNRNHVDKSKLAAARNMQQSIQQLMGQRTPMNEWIERSKKSLYNSVYSKLGEAAAEKLDNVALTQISDPVTFMRRSAFSLQLGLFNVQQLWKQAQGFTHSVAVAGPVHGYKGAASYPFVRMLGWSNGSDDMIRGVAKKASFTGWNQDDFVEMYKALRRSGMLEIGGSHSWKDDLLEPKVFQGRVGQFIDKSAVFFNEGERLNRGVAFASAYSEWRAANKFAKFDRRANDAVLRRADVLQVNMSKAGDAAWQQGIFNIPSQFYSYQLRLTEQMLGKQLTKAEKARALMTYTAMYGIPTGLLATTIPVRDWYEDIRRGQLAKGMPDDNIAIDAMHKGMMGIMTDIIAGRETNTSSVYGPGTLNFVRDATDGDHTFMQIVLGASGSIMGRVYDSTLPLLASMRGLIDEPSGDQAKIVASDVVDFMRNAKGIDNAYKLWYGLNYAKMITKGRTDIDDVTPVDVVLSSVFGIDPQTKDDTYTMLGDMKKQRERQQYSAREAKKYLKSFAEAIQQNDDSLAETYFKHAQTIMELEGMDFMQRHQVVQDFYKENEDLFDDVNRKYLEKMAVPPENGE